MKCKADFSVKDSVSDTFERDPHTTRHRLIFKVHSSFLFTIFSIVFTVKIVRMAREMEMRNNCFFS